MKIFVNVAALCCLFCVGCKDQRPIQVYQADDSEFHVLTVNPDAFSPKERFNLSAIADTVEYIPLETNDSILVGRVNKLIVRHGLMYIWDNLSESIFCFDTSGRIRHRLSARGQGPGEYGRISDFTLDCDNGNICIYSDLDRAVLVYDSTGTFVAETPVDLIFSSIAMDNGLMYAYTGKLPNEYLGMDRAQQFRLNVMENGEVKHRALPYAYKEDLMRVPLSSRNFSRYRDTLLLVEYLAPEVYALDKEGKPSPRYRIDFTTNSLQPRFEDEDVDREQLETARKMGSYTELSTGFYETSRYLFFNYARGLIGTAYVDKQEDMVHNMGYFNLDDFNNNTLGSSIAFVDEDYLYKVEEPGMLIKKREVQDLSPALDAQVEEMSETDNPVVVRISLK